MEKLTHLEVKLKIRPPQRRFCIKPLLISRYPLTEKISEKAHWNKICSLHWHQISYNCLPLRITSANSLERAAGGICLHVNADKTEYMCFNQRDDISKQKGGPLKLVDKFTYHGSSVSSTEKDINTWLSKAIDWLLVIWKSDRTNKIKLSFIQAVVVSILLYGS